LSKRLLSVLSSLAEAELETTRPAEVIRDKVLPALGSRSLRVLSLAAWLIELAPLRGMMRTFTSLSREDRAKWLKSLKPESLVADAVNMFEFIILAVHFMDRRASESIEYDRWKLIPPLRECEQPMLAAKKEPRGDYDIVIVGSGAGGAIAAWALSREGFRVAVFEAGPEPEPRELLEEYPTIRALRYYWEGGLTFTWGTPLISIPYGRVLGGTVTVNSGTMFRAPEEVLKEWEKASGVHIGIGLLEEAYRVIEKKLNINPVSEELLGGNARVMREGAKALGLSHGPVRRPLGKCRGLGECAFGCPCGGKLDMRLSFLREAVEVGAEIYVNSEVERIIIENGKARGVKVRIGNVLREVRSKAVVVAAGALNTPRLLRASGVKNRHLGLHLHIHPAAGVTGVMPWKVRGWIGTMQSYYVDSLLKTHHTLLLATFPPPGIGYSAGSIPIKDLPLYPYLASIGVQTSDECTGKVLGFRPMGVATYSICSDDLEKLKTGIELAAEILFAAGARKVYPPLKRESVATSINELKQLLRDAKPKAFKLSAYHPMSTARMAKDPDAGVVDEGGRVFGVENLYVVDASVIPSSTWVNPQLTINALALIISRSIAKDLGGM